MSNQGEMYKNRQNLNNFEEMHLAVQFSVLIQSQYRYQKFMFIQFISIQNIFYFKCFKTLSNFRMNYAQRK